jgi:hypothetical protein
LWLRPQHSKPGRYFFFAAAFLPVDFFDEDDEADFFDAEVFVADFDADFFEDAAFFEDADFFEGADFFEDADFFEGERFTSPLSPCPGFTTVLDLDLRSAASDRPTSTTSLNCPCLSRRTNRLSPGVGSISSRFRAAFFVAMQIPPRAQPCECRAVADAAAAPARFDARAGC